MAITCSLIVEDVSRAAVTLAGPTHPLDRKTVGRLEAGSMDLTLQDEELVAEGENLDLKCGLALPARDKEVEQEADDGVAEGYRSMCGDDDDRSGRVQRCRVSRRSSEPWGTTLS